MRRLLAFSVLAVASAAFAQVPARDMMLGRRALIAMRPTVRTELKLTDDQFKRLVDAFDGAVHVEGERIMMTMTPGFDMEGCEKAATKVFSADQLKRLEEVYLQQMGGLAAADPATAKKLAVTGEQMKKIESLLEKGAEDLMELFQSGGHDQDPKAHLRIREKTGDAIEKLLTESQRKTLKELQGKPMPKPKGDGALAV